MRDLASLCERGPCLGAAIATSQCGAEIGQRPGVLEDRGSALERGRSRCEII